MRMWPTVPTALVVLGIAVLALPRSLEGAVLVPISPGHGLTGLDMAGALPATVGLLWVQAGLWARRARVAAHLRAAPGPAAATLLVAGAGFGLLLASAFSTFWWWWAIGAAMLLAALAVLVARTGPPG